MLHQVEERPKEEEEEEEEEEEAIKMPWLSSELCHMS